jgi:hypothetical protein
MMAVQQQHAQSRAVCADHAPRVSGVSVNTVVEMVSTSSRFPTGRGGDSAREGAIQFAASVAHLYVRTDQ